MDFVDLQTFRAVVDHGGVTAAARHLHRVQSSISARLQALESRLGCALFERQGKGLLLTPEGRYLYGRSARIVRDMEALREELAPEVPAAILRVGSMESTAAVRLAQPLAQLRRSHPQLELALRTGTTGALLAWLEQGEIDVALVAGPVLRGALEWQPVFEEELVLVAPRQPGAARVLVTFSAGCAYREVALAWGRQQGEAFDGVVEIGSYHALVASVAAGMGVGLVPRSVLALSDVEALDVQPLAPPYSRQTTWLVSRAGGRSTAVAALRACLAPGGHRPDGQGGIPPGAL